MLPSFKCRLLQPLQRRPGFILVAALEVSQPIELLLLVVVGSPDQLQSRIFRIKIGLGVSKGVHTDDRIFTGVFEVLVIHRLFLDAASLVAGFHGAEHAAPLGDPVELGEHRLFDQVGEFLDDKTALVHVLILGQPPFTVDDELDGQRPADRLLARGGDGLVIGVGVQAVAVVVNGTERLQGGADVVELDLLAVQAAARGLDVILELLARCDAPYFSFMATAQIRRATRPITVYSGSMPLEKKKDRLGANSSMSIPRAR